MRPILLASLLVSLVSGLAFALVQGHGAHGHGDQHAALEQLRPEEGREGPFVMVSRMETAPERLERLIAATVKLGEVARKRPGLAQILVLVDDEEAAVEVISVWDDFEDFVDFHEAPELSEMHGVLDDLHHAAEDFKADAPRLASGWTRRVPPGDSKNRRR